VRKEIFVWLFSLLVVGCSNNPASVTDRNQPPSIRIKSHQVDIGETLYSIAWRYDLNVVDLANANSLYEPYIINPGQELTLRLASRSFRVLQGNDTKLGQEIPCFPSPHSMI